MTLFRGLGEAVLTRFAPHHRPVMRSFDKTVSSVPGVHFDLRTGSLDIRVVPDSGDLRVHCDVRSRDPELAEQIGITVSDDESGLRRIGFYGPFEIDGNTACSVDALLEIPSGVALSVHTSLGNIHAVGITSTFKIACSMGNAYVALSPQWQAGEIDIATGMGNIDLSIPTGLPFHVHAGTSLGNESITYQSHDDGFQARVHSRMGNISVKNS